MKKENFIIGLIVVGVVAFLLGRLSVSTKDKPAAPGGTVATSAPVQPTPPAATAGATAPAVAPTPAPTPAPTAEGAKAPEAVPAPAKPAEIAAPVRAAPVPSGASVNVVESPRKGPAEAKVTIVEISDYQ